MEDPQPEPSLEPSREEPQPERAAQTGFGPRMSEAMSEFLVNTVVSTAKIVQAAVEAQKSAQVACFHAEQSLAQARLSYVAARGLAEQLLGVLNPPDYQGLFQNMSQPPIAYPDFCSIIRRTENALLHPVLKCKPGFPARREVSPCSEHRRPSFKSEDGFQGGFRDLRSPCVRTPCVSETQDEDGTDEEENKSLPIRGRNPSRHKQVETVLLEDQIGGTYVTHRRRSPRRSPSADISPLVSEEDLNTIQVSYRWHCNYVGVKGPVVTLDCSLSPLNIYSEVNAIIVNEPIQPLICCPNRQGGSGKFLSKVTRRKDQPQRENSDSDPEQLETSAKDTGQT